MVHILLFYRILSYTFGFSLLIFVLYRYLKTKNSLVWSFFLLWLAMTLTVGTYILDYYLIINFTIDGRSLGYTLMLISILLIVITLPNFIHKLFKIRRNYVTKVLLPVSSILAILIVIPTSDIIYTLCKKSVMMLIIFSNIYSYTISLINLLKIKDIKKRKSGLLFLLLFLILFLLLYFLDINTINDNGFLFFPLFYIFIGANAAYFSPKFLTIKTVIKLTNYNLTKREEEISMLIIDGKTYKEIGEHLFISVNTVRTHVKHIYKKTETSSKIQLRKKLEGF